MSVSILNKFGDLSLLSSELGGVARFQNELALCTTSGSLSKPSAGFMGLHKSCFCHSENPRKAQVQVVSGVGFKEWPKPEVKHGDHVSLFLFPNPQSSQWSIVLTALEDGKCLESAIALMCAVKGQTRAVHGKDLVKVRVSIQVLELCLQSAQSCLWIKTVGFCNACYCVQPHKGLRIKQMLLLYNLLKKKPWNHSLSWKQGECAQLNVTTSRA